MSLIKTKAELNSWFITAERKNKTMGFVPTMGYLHEGHCSLIREAKSQNDLIVVSVFVNPTQFAPNEDFESYPRDIDRDYQIAIKAGADVVFYPSVNEIYLPGASTSIEVSGTITTQLCGASRPSHFKGVTTVVNILFNIVRPDHAYFGQKDTQQAMIIKKMVKDLHIPVKIVVCPIIREEDGLALSSRNVFLDPQERRQATCLNISLQKASEYLNSDAIDNHEVSTLLRIIKKYIQKSDLAEIDYIQILDGETLENITVIEKGKSALAAIAVRFGKTRLIDNKILSIDEGEKQCF